jgi:hypothetical protein
MLTRHDLTTQRAVLLAKGEATTSDLAACQTRLLLIQGAVAQIDQFLAEEDRKDAEAVAADDAVGDEVPR